MKKDPSSPPERSLKDQVAEDLALRNVIRLTQLEQAAANPSISWRIWVLYLVLGGFLIYFQDKLIDHLWIIIMAILAQIHTATMSVHSRIDAIQNLNKLKSERPILDLANNSQAQQESLDHPPTAPELEENPE